METLKKCLIVLCLILIVALVGCKPKEATPSTPTVPPVEEITTPTEGEAPAAGTEESPKTGEATTPEAEIDAKGATKFCELYLKKLNGEVESTTTDIEDSKAELARVKEDSTATAEDINSAEDSVDSAEQSKEDAQNAVISYTEKCSSMKDSANVDTCKDFTKIVEDLEAKAKTRLTSAKGASEKVVTSLQNEYNAIKDALDALKAYCTA